MLVLARKCGEAIVIPQANVVITVLEKHGDRIRLGIEAPPGLMVHRREVWQRIQEEQDKESGVEGASTPAPASSAGAFP